MNSEPSQQPQQPYPGQPQYPSQPPYGYAQPDYPPQFGYAQPGYPPPQQYSPAPNAGIWGTSSIGNLSAQTAAGLAYLLTFVPSIGFFIPIIMFFIEKNRFAKFHAAQATVINFGAVVLLIIFGIVGGIIGGLAGATAAATHGAGGVAFGPLFFLDFVCLFPIVIIGLIVSLIMGAIAGFQGKPTKLPIVGGLAERMSGGPITPGMPNLP